MSSDDSDDGSIRNGPSTHRYRKRHVVESSREELSSDDSLITSRKKGARRVLSSSSSNSGSSNSSEEHSDSGSEVETGEARRRRRQKRRLTDKAVVESSAAESDSSSVGASGNGCPICLGKLDAAALQGRPEGCEHIFCFECIVAWSRNNSTCPLCRTAFGHIKILLQGADLEEVPVKKITPEELELNGEYVNDIVCVICNSSDREDTLLLCDECDDGYHCACLSPPLAAVPPGQWFCPRCSRVDLDDDENESLLGGDPEFNVGLYVPRTRATERVRRAVQSTRRGAGGRNQRPAGSSSSGGRRRTAASGAASATASSSSTSARRGSKSTRKTGSKTRKSTRKAKRRRTTRTTTTTTTRRRKTRRRKGGRRKTIIRKAYASSVDHQCRIARSLGLSERVLNKLNRNSFGYQALSIDQPSTSRGSTAFDSVKASRGGIAGVVPDLHVFGSRLNFEPDGGDSDDAAPTLQHNRKSVTPPPVAGDLLGGLLEKQTVLLSKKSELKRDSSGKVRLVNDSLASSSKALPSPSPAVSLASSSGSSQSRPSLASSSGSSQSRPSLASSSGSSRSRPSLDEPSSPTKNSTTEQNRSTSFSKDGVDMRYKGSRVSRVDMRVVSKYDTTINDVLNNVMASSLKTKGHEKATSGSRNGPGVGISRNDSREKTSSRCLERLRDIADAVTAATSIKKEQLDTTSVQQDNDASTSQRKVFIKQEADYCSRIKSEVDEVQSYDTTSIKVEASASRDSEPVKRIVHVEKDKPDIVPYAEAEQNVVRKKAVQAAHGWINSLQLTAPTVINSLSTFTEYDTSHSTLAIGSRSLLLGEGLKIKQEPIDELLQFDIGRVKSEPVEYSEDMSSLTAVEMLSTGIKTELIGEHKPATSSIERTSFTENAAVGHVQTASRGLASNGGTSSRQSDSSEQHVANQEGYTKASKSADGRLDSRRQQREPSSQDSRQSKDEPRSTQCGSSSSSSHTNNSNSFTRQACRSKSSKRDTHERESTEREPRSASDERRTREARRSASKSPQAYKQERDPHERSSEMDGRLGKHSDSRSANRRSPERSLQVKKERRSADRSAERDRRTSRDRKPVNHGNAADRLEIKREPRSADCSPRRSMLTKERESAVNPDSATMSLRNTSEHRSVDRSPLRSTHVKKERESAERSSASISCARKDRDATEQTNTKKSLRVKSEERELVERDSEKNSRVSKDSLSTERGLPELLHIKKERRSVEQDTVPRTKEKRQSSERSVERTSRVKKERRSADRSPQRNFRVKNERRSTDRSTERALRIKEERRSTEQSPNRISETRKSRCSAERSPEENRPSKMERRSAEHSPEKSTQIKKEYRSKDRSRLQSSRGRSRSREGGRRERSRTRSRDKEQEERRRAAAKDADISNKVRQRRRERSVSRDGDDRRRKGHSASRSRSRERRKAGKIEVNSLKRRRSSSTERKTRARRSPSVADKYRKRSRSADDRQRRRSVSGEDKRRKRQSPSKDDKRRERSASTEGRRDSKMQARSRNDLNKEREVISTKCEAPLESHSRTPKVELDHLRMEVDDQASPFYEDDDQLQQQQQQRQLQQQHAADVPGLKVEAKPVCDASPCYSSSESREQSVVTNAQPLAANNNNNNNNDDLFDVAILRGDMSKQSADANKCTTVPTEAVAAAAALSVAMQDGRPVLLVPGPIAGTYVVPGAETEIQPPQPASSTTPSHYVEGYSSGVDSDENNFDDLDQIHSAVGATDTRATISEDVDKSSKGAPEAKVKEKLPKFFVDNEKFQAAVVREVGGHLKKFYRKHQISKEDYKEIFKKVMKKICKSSSEPKRLVCVRSIRKLCDFYVQKARLQIKKDCMFSDEVK